MRKLIFALLLSIVYFICFAQSDESTFQVQTSVQLTSTPVLAVNNADTSFNNSFVVAPILRLFHQKGFGVSYSPYVATQGNQPGIYMHTVTAGYEHYDGVVVNLDFAYTHFFFANNSSIPYSPLNNELYAYISYKKLWLAPLVSTSVGFGNDKSGQMQSGLNVAAGVTHDFEINSAKAFSAIEIAPALIANAASNEFYSFLTTSKYITHNKKYENTIQHKGRGRGGSTTTTTTTTSAIANKSFAFQNLELNLYSSFQAHHVEIVPTGSLFFPFDQATPLSGYWQIKLAYDF
jgi:hypothetical protein